MDEVSVANLAPERFAPFSINAWRDNLRKTGSLGFALLAVATSGKVFEARESAAVLAEAANNATVLRLGMLAFAVVIVAPRLAKIPLPKSAAFKAFGIFALIALVSTVWSQSVLATAGKAAEVMVGWLVVSILSGGETGGDRLKAAIQIIYYYLAAQVVFVTVMFLFRVDGFYERGSGGIAEIVGARSVGPFISANSMGYFSAALILIVAGLFLSKRMRLRSALLYGGVFAFTLICSGSRTSLAIAVVGIAAQWLYRRPPVTFLLMSMVAGFVALISAGSVLTFLQGDVSDDVFFSLSGRTWLWDTAFQAFSQSPLIGFGFGVGGRTAFALIGTAGFDADISSVHNGFLEIALGVGVLGFLPWFFAFIGALVPFFSFNRSGESGIYTLSIALLVAATTFMSLGVGGSMSEIMLLMLLSLALAAKSKGVE